MLTIHHNFINSETDANIQQLKSRWDNINEMNPFRTQIMKKQLCQNFEFRLDNEWKDDIERLKIMLTIHHNFINSETDANIQIEAF